MSNSELTDRRIAFIRRIVDRCDNIGKTKIQKISYFLQESVGVDLSYPFRMHYYGPYSDELDRALSLTKSLGFIDIKPDPDGFGYHVTSVEDREDTGITEYEVSNEPDFDQIDQAIAVLGRLETHELELYATIHFIGGPKGKRSKDQTSETVKKLKPKFSKDYIDRAYSTLKEAKLI